MWGGRLQIDAGLGLIPNRRWLYRFKFGIRLELRSGTLRPPTVTFVDGSFGDVVNYPSGLTYLSWYPSGMVRHDIGIHTIGNYHSIDPGKSTMAPMFAVEVTDRIAGQS